MLTASNFANLLAYAGLKCKPAGGNMADYEAGSAVDMPLMRVEEMYFIEAEATAFTQVLKAGQSYAYTLTVSGENTVPYTLLSGGLSFTGTAAIAKNVSILCCVNYSDNHHLHRHLA